MTTTYAWNPTEHPRDRVGRFRGIGVTLAPGYLDTVNALLSEVDKWPRVTPEEGGASPRFFGAQALMDMRSGTEILAARDDSGKLVGVGTFTDHVSGEGTSGLTADGPIQGGTFAAIEGGGMALFKAFLELAAERQRGVNFVAGNARAEKLYDKLGVPKVAKGRKGQGAVYELRFDQVLELTRDLRSLVPRDYTWNPHLHPRDPIGRFRTLFHVTSRRHRESIAKHGLIPGADQITTGYGGKLPLPGEPFVAPQDRWDYNLWLFETEQAARAAQQQLWGGSKGPDQLDVYKVRVSETRVLPDRDKWPNSVMIKDRILPQDLTLLDSPTLEDWGVASTEEQRRLRWLPGVAYGWNPEQHPRIPGGHHGGGRFVRIAPWKAISLAKSEFPESEATMETLTPDEAARVRSVWEKQSGVSAERVVGNLRDVFKEATPDVWEQGLVWYSGANEWAREKGDTHGVDSSTVAGMLSALSPMTEWGSNKHQADLMLQFYSRDPNHFNDVLPQQAAFEAREWAVARGEKWPLGAGRRNMVNAARILKGEHPETVLGQAKTRGFYNSIAEPDNPWDVVVDTHMINAAYGGLTPGPAGLLIEVDKPASAKAWGDIVLPEGADFMARKPFSWFGSPKVRGRDVGVTPLLADAVREITDEYNAEHPDDPISPMQVQAIIWTQWLKMHPAQEKRAAVKATQRATVAAAEAAMA